MRQRQIEDLDRHGQPPIDEAFPYALRDFPKVVLATRRYPLRKRVRGDGRCRLEPATSCL